MRKKRALNLADQTLTLTSRSAYVKAVPRYCRGNDAFWPLILKKTTEVRELKNKNTTESKWLQGDTNEPSYVLIGHSVLPVGRLKKRKLTYQKINHAAPMHYNLSPLRRPVAPVFGINTILYEYNFLLISAIDNTNIVLVEFHANNVCWYSLTIQLSRRSPSFTAFLFYVKLVVGSCRWRRWDRKMR